MHVFHWVWWFMLVFCWVHACGDCRNISPLEWYHFTRQVMWSREGWWTGLDYCFVGSFIWNSLCEVRPQNVWSQGTDKGSSPCSCLPTSSQELLSAYSVRPSRTSEGGTEGRTNIQQNDLEGALPCFLFSMSCHFRSFSWSVAEWWSQSPPLYQYLGWRRGLGSSPYQLSILHPASLLVL